MSFAGDVKTELCRLAMNRKCCVQAECYGILLYCNTFSAREIRIITENEALAQRLPVLFKKAFKITFDRLPEGEGKHVFAITDREKLEIIQQTFGGGPGSLALHINYGVLEERCCRVSFLRGAFLAGGSVTDPLKGYHLELVTSHRSVSREVYALLLDMEFSPKETERSGSSVLYFKQSNTIEDLLTTMGAPVSAMHIMEAKVEKDLRNSVNRRVNCETANLTKVVDAAMEQVAAIERLMDSELWITLPPKLRQTAKLRCDNPEATLTELAELCEPPVTKSAMNHRLRKLMALAGTLDQAETEL